VALTVYCWLLCLYPGSYRGEFGATHEALFRQCWPRRSASTDANFVDFYRVPSVRTLTVCSVLSFPFGDSLCNANFVFPALPCF
jgi:hypothetical protein